MRHPYHHPVRFRVAPKPGLFNRRNAVDTRFLARHWFYIGILAFAWIQIMLLPSEPEYLVSPLLLGIGATAYTSFKMVQPIGWHESRIPNIALFILDLAVCATLVILSGGLHSPFILYSLAPVVTAAILLPRIYTFIITVVTFVYVLVAFLMCSITGTLDTLAQLNTLAVYMLALFFAAVLPYLMNLKDRQRIKVRAVLSERQQLAREIHDSLCQTIYGLRWQIQMLRNGMVQPNQPLVDSKVDKLLEEAETDARNLISSLRSFKLGCSLVSELKAYLCECETEYGISCQLDEHGENPTIDELIKSEVLRISEEALRNAIKHSGCHHIQVQLLNSDSQLNVIVSDDGRGFNDTEHVEGRGLMVMKERAQSIGGRLDVLSRPGIGTEIKLKVPRKCPSELILANQ